YSWAQQVSSKIQGPQQAQPNFRKHSFEFFPEAVSEKKLFCCSSVSIMHLPCFFTEVNIKFSSKGNNVRRSMISTWPGNFFAAAFAQYTPIPYVTIQQLAPSFIFSSLAERIIFALPNGKI